MVATKDTFDVFQSIPPVLRAVTATGTGADLASYAGNTFVFEPGTITDGTHTPKLQESDAFASGYTDVAASDQVGTLSALASFAVQKVSYIGGKRYVRMVVTVSGSPATGGTIGGHAVLSGKRKQP